MTDLSRPMLEGPGPEAPQEAAGQEAPTAVVVPGSSKPTSTGTGLKPGVRAGPARFFRSQPIDEEEEESEEDSDLGQPDTLYEEWTTSDEDSEEELDDEEVGQRYMAERRQ